MIFTPEYYERMRTLEESGWWNAGMRRCAARLLALSDLPEAGAMLDVGCGSGQSLRWFRSLYPGWTTYGLDVAREGLAAAFHLGESAVVEASATSLPFSDASIDSVITLDVLQHLPLDGGDMEALSEMHRVLRPNGILLLRTNAQAFPVTADDPAHDFHKYGTRELRGKLAVAGFEVLRLSRINALLGLAEIPRELRARGARGDAYHGILADPAPERRVASWLKRGWLALEGRAVALNLRLPLGRTHLGLCRKKA